METPVLLWFHLLLSVIFCNGFHVQGPSGALTARMGGSVTLPCYVETLLPIEELEVEWKRIDSGSLVHLWQNEESQPESQTQSYRERAHFFTEEVAHGNFSLLLTNVTQEDAGVYKCLVYTNQDSGETLIKIMEIERLIVSGAHVISAYAGEDITLNCSVDSHIPSEKIEEVLWKRDNEIAVLLYKNGITETESTHGSFKGRVEFFNIEERNKGNFSMRLKDVRFEDKGIYMCLAFLGDLSDNTTVEVQQLGFSFEHIGIFVLCIFGFCLGILLLCCQFYTFCHNYNNNRRAQSIQHTHVLCPNIIMFIAFILWGHTEGLLMEALTCSVLNFGRILFLFWIIDHVKPSQGCVCQVTKHLAVLLQYVVITVVAYLPIILDYWNKKILDGKAFILIFSVLWLLLIFRHAFAVVTRVPWNNSTGIRKQGCETPAPSLCLFECGKMNLQQVAYRSYISTEFSNLLQIYVISVIYGIHTVGNITFVLLPLLPCIVFGLVVMCKWQYFFLTISLMMILQIVIASGSIYFHYNVIPDVNERVALTFLNVLLYILTMMTLFNSLKQLSVTRCPGYKINVAPPESNSKNTETHQAIRCPACKNNVSKPNLWCVFVIGSVLVVFVNAAALLWELILKARNGERTVDLRLIVIPSECVFAACVLALQIYVFCTENRKRFKKDVRICCECTHAQKDSNSHQANNDQEQQN